MGKKFKELDQEDLLYIRELYEDKNISQSYTQTELSNFFNVSTRTIRAWAKNIGVGSAKPLNKQRIMVYDIETSRAEGKFWWTGKTYINYKQITKLPRIISIAWKYLGEDTVYTLAWDEYQNDKEMLQQFLPEYNDCDMVIGQNNDKFDNRWIAGRAALHNLEFNPFVKSFDIMKQTKRLFRIPSYSMDFIAKFFGLTLKQSHEGIKMWDMIEDGTDEQKAEYLAKMIEYNVGDIVTTEEIYYRIQKYAGHKIHFGVFNGGEKYTCPDTGSTDVRLYKTTYTTAGTIQHIMQSNETKALYKIANNSYMKYLEDKLNNKI